MGMINCKKCGSDNVRILYSGIGHFYFGYCNNCTYEPMQSFESPEEAINFWNVINIKEAPDEQG